MLGFHQHSWHIHKLQSYIWRCTPSWLFTTSRSPSNAHNCFCCLQCYATGLICCMQRCLLITHFQGTTCKHYAALNKSVTLFQQFYCIVKCLLIVGNLLRLSYYPKELPVIIIKGYICACHIVIFRFICHTL